MNSCKETDQWIPVRRPIWLSISLFVGWHHWRWNHFKCSHHWRDAQAGGSYLIGNVFATCADFCQTSVLKFYIKNISDKNFHWRKYMSPVVRVLWQNGKSYLPTQVITFSQTLDNGKQVIFLLSLQQKGKNSVPYSFRMTLFGCLLQDNWWY